MPIEIKELVIKVNVSESGGAQSNRGGADSSRGNQGGDQQVDKKAIVQECVDQVMDILKKKMER